MGLKHIKLPEAQIELPGGDKFSVRGLSLDDIAFLMSRHGDELRTLFDSFAAQGEVTTDAIAAFAIPVIRTAPVIAAELIACGAGEVDDESIQIARSLPFPVQVDALEKVARLTFEAGGGPKKLLETVIRLAQGTTGLLQSLQT
jgi:hypothetical protein